ncbi:MAG: NAD(P)-binding domain-containing protein, partial [Rhodanobacter sp.]
MQLGMIGLGKMGANMAQRLLKGGHKVTGFDPSAEARKKLQDNDGAAADSLKALVQALPAPRVVWLMVPSGKVTNDTVDALLGLLEKGDTMIDGGNSNYKDSLGHAAKCTDKGVNYVDCGTSGGGWGLAEGYS